MLKYYLCSGCCSHVLDELGLLSKCFLLLLLLVVSVLLGVSLGIGSFLFLLFLNICGSLGLTLEFGFAPLATFISDPSWVSMLDILGN
jgi:hypothetical protein